MKEKKMLSLLEKARKSVQKKTSVRPKIAVVLGSGLGDFAKQIKVESEVSYSELKGFPVSTVAGHDGKFIFGYSGKVPVVLMKGRIHYYEGYPMEKVVMPIRLLSLLGVEKIILTNAAGSINTDFRPGDLMMITDQISAFVPSPLRGKNLDEFGTRFPDMSSIYSKEIQSKIEESAKNIGIELRKGVYVQWQGPNYESPAEIRMFRTLGADAAGMSTACEAIAARHSGISVGGISCLTNMAAGIHGTSLSHKEVQEVADSVHEKFEKLVVEIIGRI